MASEFVTIARDDNCDLFLDSKGNIALAHGIDAYAQIINAKMRTSLGELQLNMGKGIPYFETVFIDKSFIPIWKNEVVRQIESLGFVKNVSSFTCNLDKNMIKYIAEIETDKGTLTING